MPAVAEADPFQDLGSPQDLIGGEYGAPAMQRDAAGNLSEVPKAQLSTLPAPDAGDLFSDLVPKEAAVSREDLGMFNDLVPKPKTETEKAMADTPSFMDYFKEAVTEGVPGIPIPGLKDVAKGLNYGRNVAIEATSAFSPELSARVFGQTDASLRPEEKAGPLISPAAAQEIIGQLPDWAGGNTPVGRGLAEGMAGALSSFSNPAQLAQLPAFAIPGFAETYVLNVLSELPHQGKTLWAAIKLYGLNSKEVGQMAAEYGITDFTAFLAAKGTAAAKYRATQKEIDAAPARPASEPEAAPVPEARSAPETPPAAEPAPTTVAPEPEPGNDWTRATEEPVVEPEQVSPEPGPTAPPEPIGVEEAIAEIQRRNLSPQAQSVFDRAKDAKDEFTGVDATDLPLADRRALAEMGLSFTENRENRAIATYPASRRAADLKKAVLEKQQARLQPGEEQGSLPTGDTKTPEQLAAEEAATNAELQTLQEKQDVRVGAAKPLAAGEDVRPEADMFQQEAQPDIFDQPAAKAKAQATEEARMKAEEEQALLDEFQDYQESGGTELMTLVKQFGGMPAKGSKFDIGELAAIREHWPTSKTFSQNKEGFRFGDYFKKDAGDLDSLTQFLRDRGIDVETPGQAVDLINDRMRTGKPLYGNEARGQENQGFHLRERAGEAGYTDLIPDVIDFGRRIYGKGMDFVKWSAEMVRHLGEKVKEHLKDVWEAVRKATGDERGSIGGNIGLNIKGKRNDLNAATTNRSMKLQTSFADAERAQKEINKVASERRQNAMSIFREANGDQTVLKDWQAKAKQKWFKKAATDALSLKPAEIAMTQKVGQTFEILEKRGNKYDVLSGHKDNYVPHVWDVSKKGTGFGSSKLQDRFKYNKARTFETFFDGDQAGFKPKTLALGKLLPAYLHEMNTVIADRQFVQEAIKGKSTEGTPLVVPSGNAKQVEATEYVVSPVKPFEKSVYDTDAEAQAALAPGQIVTPRRVGTTLVTPRGFANVKDAAGNPIDQSSYKFVDQPALANWRWLSTDEKGNSVIFKGDLKVHPELAKRLNAMMGQSEIRRWYNEPSSGLSTVPRAIAKGLDTSQSVMKREMFGLLAPFHQVQEGTHAIGHGVNPIGTKQGGIVQRVGNKLGLRALVNPIANMENMAKPTAEHMDMMRHGLMLMPEKSSGSGYIEGVGGKNSFPSQIARKYGGAAGRLISDVIDGYQGYLFHQYIPSLKAKTWRHIQERNMKRFAKKIASGEVTEADVKFLTSEQTNAAYGHLNYALLDRNPTMQHILQLGLLAPDFLEARSRFVGQALKPSKAGHEQFRAIALLAAVQAGTAFTLSALMGDEWDPKHPFEVTHKGRTYFLRSVPEDLFRLFFSGADKRREFVSARVNPAAQKAWQMVSGINYRGEKVGFWDTIGELLTNYIPITARSLPGVRELTATSRNNPVSPLEQLAGSMGLKISRYSPITKVYQLAHDWEKSQGIAADTGSYPVSKYQQLRYALEDGNMEKAQAEYKKIRATGVVPGKIASGFKESITHPFTSSKATDEAFRKSLNAQGKNQFDQAMQRRQDILKRFSALVYPQSLP